MNRTANRESDCVRIANRTGNLKLRRGPQFASQTANRDADRESRIGPQIELRIANRTANRTANRESNRESTRTPLFANWTMNYNATHKSQPDPRIAELRPVPRFTNCGRRQKSQQNSWILTDRNADRYAYGPRHRPRRRDANRVGNGRGHAPKRYKP